MLYLSYRRRYGSRTRLYFFIPFYHTLQTAFCQVFGKRGAKPCASVCRRPRFFPKIVRDVDIFLHILYNEANQKAKDYDRIMYERRKERAQKSYDLYDSPYVKYSKGSK